MWSSTQILPVASHPVPIKNFCGWQGFQPPASCLLSSLTSFLPTFPLFLSLSVSLPLSLLVWTRFLEVTSLDTFGTAALEPLVIHSSWNVPPPDSHMANSYFLQVFSVNETFPPAFKLTVLCPWPHLPCRPCPFCHSTRHCLPYCILCSFMMFLVCLPLLEWKHHKGPRSVFFIHLCISST